MIQTEDTNQNQEGERDRADPRNGGLSTVTNLNT